MANYVYVENNQIKEYHDRLPKNWKNVSGLYLLQNDVEKLIELGWYPVVHLPETHDEQTSYLSGYVYEIHDDHVKQIPYFSLYTEQELEERQNRKQQEFFSALREERDRKLAQTDWTQVLDVQNLHTEQWRNSWRDYRQSLRDLPQQYNLTNNFDIQNVNWPLLPE